MSDDHLFDVLIIGSGAAGMSAALRLPETARIAILSKGGMAAGSTEWAQGGIAAVLSGTDTLESHIHDTLVAGAGLCNPDTVQFVVNHARANIDWLTEQGMNFDLYQPEEGRNQEYRRTAPGPTYHLTKEGGHSKRRVIHVADATGHALQSALEAQVRQRANITIYEDYAVIDLIFDRMVSMAHRRCHGAYALNKKAGEVVALRARATVLATGGASKVYLYTSNPDGATGDGIAMAWRAGCRVANMEFNQFHPTVLYHPEAKSFLITEAIRGEGGRLRLPGSFETFMERFDPRAELAPRDIVARAIDHEMKRLGLDFVLLDITHKPAAFITEHFPTIYKQCLEFGFDITTQPIPVVPAAHYTCGGVVTDLHGRADLNGLYVIGESACTGLHGANRMASNSLLECLVFGEAAAADIAAQLPDLPPPPPVLPWDESRVTDSDEEVVVTHNWSELRHFMWDYVGIVRTSKRLERAKRRIGLLRQEIQDYFGNFRVSGDLLELRNLVEVADLIVQSAMLRHESRGLHYTADYPMRDDSHPPRDTVLTPVNR